MILVTGGSGFIGSALIRELINSELDDVVNIDTLTYAGNKENLESIKDNKGYFFEPTVLTDVPNNARMMNEEPFGPLAPITPFQSFDEVVKEANRLPYGLAAFAFTNSSKTAEKRPIAIAENGSHFL